MGLSKDLLKDFAEVTNDSSNQNKTKFLFGKARKVGQNYSVQFDGSDVYTPVVSTIDLSDDDRVVVMVQNHSGTITSNVTSKLVNRVTLSQEIQTASAGIFDTVEANYVKTNYLEANYITATAIEADYVKTATLEADYLNAEYITTHYLTADEIQTNYLDTVHLHAQYATIDLANIEAGSIETYMLGTGVVGTAQIADGSITDAKIVGLTANKITAGTLDAGQIDVVNLNAANITVGTINGNVIPSGVIDFSKLSSSVTSVINGSVADVEVLYALSTSTTVAPTSGWSTTAPAWESGKYMWQKTVQHYSDGTSSESRVTCIAGARGADGEPGEPGEPGTAVTVTATQYQASESGTTAPTGTWSDTVVIVPSGQYLWTRVTYSDGTYAYTVAKQGVDGQNGLGGINLALRTGNSATKPADTLQIEPYDLVSTLAEMRLEEGASLTVSFDYAAVDIPQDGATVYVGVNESPYTIFAGQLITQTDGLEDSMDDYVLDNNGEVVEGDTDDTSIGHIEITTTITSAIAASIANKVRIWVDAAGEDMIFTVSKFKLEVGDHATNWFLALEDLSRDRADIKNSTFIQATAPAGSEHKVGDIWFNTADNDRMSYWNGAGWAPQEFGETALAAGSITTSRLAASAVTAAKIQAGAITTEKIAAGAITADTIAAGAITSNKIYAGAITSEKIYSEAITTDKIAAGAITAGLIQSEAITTYHLGAGVITSEKIKAGAITANEIASGAITTVKIQAGAVTAGTIASNAITTEKINASAITTAKIAANAVTADKIVAGAITTAKLAASAVTANEIASNAITAAKIKAGEVDADAIAAGAITTAKLSTNAVTTDKLNANAVTAAKIATGAITTDKLAANAVTAAKIDVGNLFAQAITASGSITGGTFVGGTIKSSDYSYSSGNYSTKGMQIDLSGKTIRTPKFAVTSAGVLYATGASINGGIQATSLEATTGIYIYQAGFSGNRAAVGSWGSRLLLNAVNNSGTVTVVGNGTDIYGDLSLLSAHVGITMHTDFSTNYITGITGGRTAITIQDAGASTGINTFASVRCTGGAWGLGALNSDNGFKVWYANNARIQSATNGADALYTFGYNGTFAAKSISLTGSFTTTSTIDATGNINTSAGNITAESGNIYCFPIDDTAATRAVICTGSGNARIARIWLTSATNGQLSSYRNGSSWSNYNFTVASSDIRLKENVEDTEVSSAMDLVSRIKMRSFDWKQDKRHQKLGFIADELEELDPDLATGGGYDEDTGNMNIKSVDTFYLIGYLTKALQEANDRITKLERRLNHGER